jgi:hypothetical protein
METTSIKWGLMLLAVVVLFYFMFGRPQRVRRRLFIKRDAPEFEDWFAKYYKYSGVTPIAVFGVLDALSFEVGCSPTQLLPTDRIDQELSYHPKVHDSFELADNSLEQFLRSNGVIQPLDNSEWETIDDVVRAVDIAIKSAQRANAPDESPPDEANRARRGDSRRGP